MLIPNLFLISLLAVTAPAPAPTPAARELKTIITVISSPYCNSLAEHFNGAMTPMLANDRTLDGVNVQLVDLNDLFSQPDYVERFLHVRDTLLKQETVLNESMEGIQSEINQFRSGAALSTDPHAASEIRDSAQDLQTAYDHQRQLSIDLQGLYQSMLNYPITRVHPALGGFDPTEMAEPPEKRNIKSYLRFDGQRDVIDSNEGKAVDIAYTAATVYCVPKGKASPSPSP